MNVNFIRTGTGVCDFCGRETGVGEFYTEPDEQRCVRAVYCCQSCQNLGYLEMSQEEFLSRLADAEAKRAAAAAAESTDGSGKKGRLRNKDALFIAGILVLGVIFMIFALNFSPGKSLKKMVDSYYTALNDRSASQLVELMRPQWLCERDKGEYNYDAELDAMNNKYCDVLSWEFAHHGGGKDIEYKIKNIREIKGKDLKEYQEFFKDEFDVKITDVSRVKVVENYSDTHSDRGTEEEVEKQVVLWWVKCDGEWYVMDESMMEKKEVSAYIAINPTVDLDDDQTDAE